jgi:hypothetical protein
MWAKEIIYDHAIYNKSRDQNVTDLSDFIKSYKEKISADSIILLDKNGIILSQEGSVHKTGDSLKYYDIVKETIYTKDSTTKIARENESFILYSSAVLKKNNKLNGIILVGYFINDIFLENIKKNTDLEIAMIGNSAVMSSTLWEGEENLDRLPINYLHYQNLLKNEKHFKEVIFNCRFHAFWISV